MTGKSSRKNMESLSAKDLQNQNCQKISKKLKIFHKQNSQRKQKTIKRLNSKRIMQIKMKLKSLKSGESKIRKTRKKS